ncbi:hypothetical protein Moror_11287 [Moniliophthora roreri MCA 2997]|uniref:Uncharacterized protein n=2 Tax=Moniliophthora roreri TaxID=221103 RepID=V2X5M7_MONRO|nr:hypothetical protein Moror_11287 [Moniliophthora roreri MCA 2997]
MKDVEGEALVTFATSPMERVFRTLVGKTSATTSSWEIKKAQALAGRRNTIGKETDKEEFFKKMTKLKESGKFEGDLPFRKRLRGDSGALLPPENPGGFVGVSSPSNGQRGGLGEELLGVLLSLDLDDDGDVNDENVYGFSPGDVGSLVEQGNMPWDPEATVSE